LSSSGSRSDMASSSSSPNLPNLLESSRRHQFGTFLQVLCIKFFVVFTKRLMARQICEVFYCIFFFSSPTGLMITFLSTDDRCEFSFSICPIFSSTNFQTK
jgi:hypothetical protein